MGRKSSGVAKGGLITGIIGTSLAGALLASGAGNNGGGNGGLLGGLFGNGGPTTSETMQSIYDQSRLAEGLEAKTELQMVEKWIAPMNQQLCALQAKVAVNDERDQKNQVINSLMFKIAEMNAQNLYEKSQCCCEKNQIAIANLAQTLDRQDQCLYDRLDSKIDCVADKATMRTDATFALRKAQVDAQIAENMCGVIKGKPYLSPCQMADPYMGGQFLLSSRQVFPANYVSTYNDCGCSDWAW